MRRRYTKEEDIHNIIGGLIDMPRQSVISDLMSWAARYNSFTLSLQSTIEQPDILSVEAALHLEAEVMAY